MPSKIPHYCKSKLQLDSTALIMYAIIKFWRDLGYYGNSVSGRHLTKTPNGGFLVSGTKGVFKTDSSGSLLWNYSGVWGAFSSRQAVDGSVIVTGPGASGGTGDLYVVKIK